METMDFHSAFTEKAHGCRDITSSDIEDFKVDLKSFRTKESLIDSVSQVTILGDREFKIYEGAVISIESIPINLIQPSACYLLKSGVDQQENFHDFLKAKHSFEIFNLETGLIYSQDGKDHFISPPVVEHYTEENGEEVYVLIDGIHRVFVAKKLGHETLNVILVRGAKLPPASMPVPWGKVKTMDVPPPTDEKKVFRNTFKFPSVINIDTKIDSRYILYRDFSPLGSHGVR